MLRRKKIQLKYSPGFHRSTSKVIRMRYRNRDNLITTFFRHCSPASRNRLSKPDIKPTRPRTEPRYTVYTFIHSFISWDICLKLRFHEYSLGCCQHYLHCKKTTEKSLSFFGGSDFCHEHNIWGILNLYFIVNLSR
jgi:hypothetical protein